LVERIDELEKEVEELTDEMSRLQLRLKARAQGARVDS
jgi:hypothetical protein